MRHSDPIAERLEMPRDRIGDEYGAMAAAGAADGDRDVRLPFLLELRDGVFHGSFKPGEKLQGFRLRVHELDDRRVASCLRLEFRDKVGVRKKANVEDEIGNGRDTILETEADQENQQS